MAEPTVEQFRLAREAFHNEYRRLNPRDAQAHDEATESALWEFAVVLLTLKETHA